MSNPDSNSLETVVELSRLNNLSDCIYAFALTLLVLDIRLPDNTSSHDLIGQLIGLAPKLLIYLMSFVVIGGAWGSHQRMLSQVKRGDGLLLWITLLSLLFVTFLPATASILGQFPGEVIAVLCFAVNVILIQLGALWLWRHANKHRLINPAIDPRTVISIGHRLSLGVGGFAFSLILTLINIDLVYFVWIGLFIFIFVTDWLSWEQTLKSTQSAVSLEGAVRGQLAIVHGAGHLNMMTDSTDSNLVQGAFGGGVDSHTEHIGDLLDVHLEAPKTLGFMDYRFPWAWIHASTLDWSLKLNPHIPLKLQVTTGADQVDLNLTDTQITEFTLTTKESTVDLRLPASVRQAQIQASSSSLVIQIPTETAARIHATNSISNLEVDPKRFSRIEDGKAYVTSNYETASNRIEIHLEQTLSFVKFI
jgi:uncharacterized membrane protein